MASNLLRVLARRSVQLPQRALATSAIQQQQVALSQEDKDKFYPKLGNRDIVGFGWNGLTGYIDRAEFPCPPVRFKENTPEVLALREKEKGDWKGLSIEEKKALYRASFRETFAEMKAPTGAWKSVVSIILLALSVTGWAIIYVKKFVYPPMPHTITREWQEATLDKMIAQGQGHVEGISSKYDYEKGKFK